MTAAGVAEALRIPPDLLAAAGWADAGDLAVREALGHHGNRGADLGGILMPIRQPRTGEHLGDVCRVSAAVTSVPRYLQPQGCRWLIAYATEAEALDDCAVPAALVENPKSALAMVALARRSGRRLVAIATLGAWSWRRTVDRERDAAGELRPVTGPSASLNWLAWPGRDAVLALDGDTRTNQQVAAAQRALAHELAGRGASVRIAKIPREAGDKAGPDDVLDTCGDDAVLKMLDAAKPWADCAVSEVEAEIAAAAADRKAGPVLAAIEAIAAVADPARRGLLVGQLADLKIAGVTKAFIEAGCARHHAEAEAQRKAAAEAARWGKLLGLRVDGAAILDAITAFARRYVGMAEAQAEAVALAVANTYVFRAAGYCPILLITAPAKRCGKSTLLEVIRLLAWRPWMTGRTTTATLVAKCAAGCALLLDEADAAMEQDREYVAALRAVLDCRFEAGKPASIMVPAPGGGWTPEDRDVYGPTFIAAIGKMPDTVMDRAIVIELRRKGRGDAVDRFRRRHARPVADTLVEQLQAWAAQHAEALTGAEPALPEPLNDRQQDIAEPLLAIADAAGGEWPERARRALVELCTGGAAADESTGTKLLADVRTVFDGGDRADPEATPPIPPMSCERITSAELAERLAGMESRPWSEWGRSQKPISKAQLARQLGRFGITPGSIRQPDGSTPKGYSRGWFSEAWERYLPSPSGPSGDAPLPNPPLPIRHTATTRVNTGESGNFQSATESPCGALENGVLANNDGPCGGVAVSNPQDRQQDTQAPLSGPPDGGETLGAAYRRARQAGLVGGGEAEPETRPRHSDL